MKTIFSTLVLFILSVNLFAQDTHNICQMKKYYKYNDDCLLISKQTKNEIITFKYHPKFKKIENIHILNKYTNEEKLFRYKYDKDGNLYYAQDSNNREIKLQYNKDFLITKMFDLRNNSILKIEYNETGKPTVIELEGIGSIVVEYDKNDEIKYVGNEGNQEALLQVTETFQLLLSLVNPTGIKLSL